MTFMILDKNFAQIAEIKEALSVIWDRRLNSPGTWQITCSAKEMHNLMAGEYVYRSDRKELGVIYQLGMSRDAGESKTCYAKGYFAEQLLYDRVLEKKYTMNDTPELVSFGLVNWFFVQGAGDEGRINEHIKTAEPVMYDMAKILFQGEGKSVADACYEVEAETGLYHKLEFDGAQTLTYYVLMGEEKGVTFQDTLANVLNASYSQDRTETPNVVYVAGAGDDDDRVVMKIDRRNAGDQAKETYVDARSLAQSYKDEYDRTIYYTDEEYAEMLATRGRQVFENSGLLESFSLEVDPNSPVLKYMEDYDLGDICSVVISVVDGQPITMTKQITEIREAIEKQSMSVSVTFGTPAKTSMKKYVRTESSTNTQTSNAGVGNLSKLKTENKRTLVDAINEVSGGGGGASKYMTVSGGGNVTVNFSESDGITENCVLNNFGSSYYLAMWMKSKSVALPTTSRPGLPYSVISADELCTLDVMVRMTYRVSYPEKPLLVNQYGDIVDERRIQCLLRGRNKTGNYVVYGLYPLYGSVRYNFEKMMLKCANVSEEVEGVTQHSLGIVSYQEQYGSSNFTPQEVFALDSGLRTFLGVGFTETAAGVTFYKFCKVRKDGTFSAWL